MEGTKTYQRVELIHTMDLVPCASLGCMRKTLFLHASKCKCLGVGINMHFLEAYSTGLFVLKIDAAFKLVWFRGEKS